MIVVHQNSLNYYFRATATCSNKFRYNAFTLELRFYASLMHFLHYIDVILYDVCVKLIPESLLLLPME